MVDWIMPLAIDTLLRIVKAKQDRHKWAKALAKVFVAIEQAAEHDQELSLLIASKRGELA
jgi:hypothetical protein